MLPDNNNSSIPRPSIYSAERNSGANKTWALAYLVENLIHLGMFQTVKETSNLVLCRFFNQCSHFVQQLWGLLRLASCGPYVVSCCFMIERLLLASVFKKENFCLHCLSIYYSKKQAMFFFLLVTQSCIDSFNVSMAVDLKAY